MLKVELADGSMGKIGLIAILIITVNYYSYSYVHNILIIRSCGWMDVSFCHSTSTASHHQTFVVWPLWQILILPVAPFRCHVTRYAVTITSVM